MKSRNTQIFWTTNTLKQNEWTKQNNGLWLCDTFFLTIKCQNCRICTVRIPFVKGLQNKMSIYQQFSATHGLRCIESKFFYEGIYGNSEKMHFHSEDLVFIHQFCHKWVKHFGIAHTNAANCKNERYMLVHRSKPMCEQAVGLQAIVDP